MHLQLLWKAFIVMDHTKFTRQPYLVVVFLNEYIEVQCSLWFINYKPNSEPGILLLKV